jgi:PAS domain S-box-containing protein
MKNASDERVLILAPKGRDLELICRYLEESGIICAPCKWDMELTEEIRRGAGVVLLTAEALTPALMRALEELLADQPPWSDVHLVLLGGNGQSEEIMESLGGSLTILERPTQPLTLLTTVGSALASRRRQYRTRDLLLELSMLNRDLEKKSQALEKANEALRAEAEDRMRAEELNRRLASIVKSSKDAIVGTAADGTITAWNKAAERIFGYTAEEIIGCSITSIHPPERGGEKEKTLEAVLRGEPVENHETVRITKEGRRIQVSLNLSPIKDSSGTIVGSSGIIRDVSRLKQAEDELQDYMARLERSNRDLQDFASIASHDLREPLRKIMIFGERLKEKFGDSLGEQGKDYVERMQAAAERMQSLIDALLDYSRVTTKAQPHVPVDLSEVIREVLTDLEARIEETGGRVELETLPTIEADPNQMRQLFQNLIGNGLKFHGKEKPVVHIDSLVRSDGICQVQVKDNGIGFDAGSAEKIFAPFQRLHGRSSPYKGTGMGLAICKKIVERHGGTISAASKPGEGSTFAVTLPLVSGLNMRQVQDAYMTPAGISNVET